MEERDVSESPITESQKNQSLHSLSFVQIHLLCSSILVLILINLLCLLSFGNIGLALLVEFGTNTLASLIYFPIPVVANHMRYLGAQTANCNRQGN